MTAARFRVFCLWLADMAAIVLVWTVAVVGYKALGLGRYELREYLAAWPVPILFGLINLFARLYHGRVTYPGLPVSPVEELRRIMLSSAGTHLLVMAVLGFSHREDDVSRMVLAVCGATTGFVAIGLRSLVRGILHRFGIGRIPAVLMTDDHAEAEMRMRVLESPYYGFRIVRRLRTEKLGAAVKTGVSHLIWCGDAASLATRHAALKSSFSFIVALPTRDALPRYDARAVAVGPHGGLELVNQRRLAVLRVEKAVVDFALAALLFLCSLPLFILVPVLIKLTSRGPVLYRAYRLGRRGRPIRIWKFRSMYADADRRLAALLASDPKLAAEYKRGFKLKNDPRVTPLGRFLRKTSIDELPQLFNVFAGDMALVGPRPIVEAEVAYYGKDYKTFASVKPGVTGLWQASGRSSTDYSERVALDVFYVNNWSPWMDLWIVLKTVSAVLTSKGAC